MTVLTVSLLSCVSCATAGNAQDMAALADTGEWGLAEIVTGGETVVIDRTRLDVFSDAFTLKIFKMGDAGQYRFSGKAAPNRFNMPVTVEKDGTLTISPPAATLMAALFEPDVLKEKEYLQYLANTKSVTSSGGRLVLETADAAGQSVTLTFVPFTATDR
jgi:hypothetical protein